MLSKEQFINAINEVHAVSKYQRGLNNFFRKNGVDGYIFQPDCTATVINILHIIMGEKDKNEWISYFCFELDYGEKWKAGTIKDENDNDIVLQTAENLYELLMRE